MKTDFEEHKTSVSNWLTIIHCEKHRDIQARRKIMQNEEKTTTSTRIAWEDKRRKEEKKKKKRWHKSRKNIHRYSQRCQTQQQKITNHLTP